SAPPPGARGLLHRQLGPYRGPRRAPLTSETDVRIRGSRRAGLFPRPGRTSPRPTTTAVRSGRFRRETRGKIVDQRGGQGGRRVIGGPSRGREGPPRAPSLPSEVKIRVR